MSIDDIIERVNLSLDKSGKLSKQMELELRIKQMTEDKFNEIYNKIDSLDSLGEAETLEGSIALQYGGMRKELKYQGAKKLSETVITKNELAKYVSKEKGIERFKLSFSEELPYKDPSRFDNKLSESARIKLRKSFMLSNGWRVDFTYSKTLGTKSSISKDLMDVKRAFFENPSVGGFLKQKPKIPGIEYELEAEWHGGKISESNIDEILSVLLDTSLDSYQSTLESVVQLIQGRVSHGKQITLKTLVDAPLSFYKSTYYEEILPNIDQYFLSDKADGERCLVVWDGAKSMAITANKIVKIALTESPDGITILDCEMIGPKEFYAFDLLFADGKSLISKPYKPYKDRVEVLEELNLPDEIHKKILVKLTKENYATEIKQMVERKTRTYKSDGLIFTHEGESSNKSKPKIWKWKPAELSTIDFLTVPVPANVLGVEPYMPKPGHNLYWLFCGMNRGEAQRLGLEPLPEYKKIFPGVRGDSPKSLIPVNFSVPQFPNAYNYYHPGKPIEIPDDLPGVVGEYLWDGKSFKLEKLRPDKDIGVKTGTFYGNSCKVARETLDLVLDPFTLEDLVSPVVGSAEKYFQTSKSDEYKPMVKFNNFVVSRLLKSISKVKWVLDLAAGRGNHLLTYNGFGVENGLFVDVDKAAIAELLNRVNNFGDNKLYLYNHFTKPDKYMKVFAKVVDLDQNYASVLGEISEFPLPKKGEVYQFDAVVMTFALHYIVRDLDSMNNFADLIDSALKVGGVLILTLMNGKRVYDLLGHSKESKKPKEWNSPDKRYSIKKLYPDNAKWTDFGLKISLIHPFSAGEYYEENLVGIDGIVKVFTKRGYKVRQDGSFLDYIGNFEKFNNEMFQKMNNFDKIYSGLYQYLVLWRS